MTISSEESPRIQYAGPISAGTTLSFPYSYIDKSQVKAQISDEDVWALDVDYSVGTESITTISTVAAGETLTLYRRTVLDQQASFPQNAKFNSEKINDALDKLTMQQQEQQEALGRSVKFSLDVDTSITDVTIPAPVAGKTLKWNDAETGLVNSDYDPDEAIAITTAAAEDAAEDAAAAQVSATSAANSLSILNSTIGAAVSSATAAAAASAISAQGYAEDADEAATRAEVIATTLECVIPASGDEGKFLQVDETSYTNGYNFVDINPQLPIVEVGTINTDFILQSNTVTRGTLNSDIDITLPTVLESGVENRVVFDFASTISDFPDLITSGIVCWSSVNNNRKPVELSVDNTERNQLLFSTVDGGAHWNAEYRTFKERSSDTVIYGYYVDTADSNPATRVHYVEDNASFSDPSYMNFVSDSFHYGDWESPFFMPRPVMLKYDGTVDYELNPNDYTKKKDGTASAIASIAYGGNAMIGWPTIYTKRYTVGNYQYVLKSNKQIDSSWKAYSWYNKNNILRDEVYTAIYQPANISSVLRSLSGQTIFTSNAGSTELTYALANGSTYGWYTGVWADWVEIQELLVLMCKSTDIQAKFGQGRSSAANATTGEANSKGMFYGTSGNGMLKIFGMENYYGNYWKRIAGCVYTASGYAIKMTQGTADGSTATDYNSTGSGYIVPGLTMSGTSGGYISAATLTGYGFLPTVVSGSSSTYFCDGAWFAAGSYALVGGAYVSGLLAGAFALALHVAFSDAGASVGASLSCKPL